MSDLFKALASPLPPNRVNWRVGPTNKDKTKGMALAYIDARDVMDHLDNVCGPGGWQNRYSHAEGKTICEIGVKSGDEWIWKADGAGDSDMEAAKGALSDAFKRAAVRWGVGRYLYDVESPWVEIEARGNSYFIPDRELARLRKSLSSNVPQTGPAPTTVAEPSHAPTKREPLTPRRKSDAPEMKLYAKMSMEINGLRSLETLTAWAKNEVNVANFHDLPADLRTTLQNQLSHQRNELAKLNPVAAG